MAHALPIVSETVEVGEAVRNAVDQMHRSSRADQMTMHTSQHLYVIS
jgi:Ser-tRNA(Ala) deacylase AlaX